jgi:hypothetical protein
MKGWFVVKIRNKSGFLSTFEHPALAGETVSFINFIPPFSEGKFYSQFV